MQQIELPGLELVVPQAPAAYGGAMPGRFGIALDPMIDLALAGHAPVYVGVSGGKDSQALAYRVQAHLNAIGHVGVRALIHADLGRIEWRDSAPVCERLAERLGWELVTVRRPAGDMVDRWLSRWAANVERYCTLSCVKLIMPWSSAVQRFCTSELKSAVIARAIRARHPVGPVISAVGLRRDESAARARRPVAKVDTLLSRARGVGLAWNAIIHWPRQDVLDYIAQCGGVLHEAYRIYGSSRVSCAFCVLASRADLQASARCTDNAGVYRELVELEVCSTFSFQSGYWLGDVAPELLGPALRSQLAEAKERAALRQAAEMEIPAHLLYEAGWPTCLPTPMEARHLASVRRRVAEAVGIAADCLDGEAVRDRYVALMALHAQRQGA
ncbi:phosphoadenosine phosphosulfate reductase domain-containing protein [Burkholderia vietnamiensis]|uniref:phosphoadenosine phosphosulfate reductase domain-containing protein n=1 Tax=Burkholderia vietnamiensis TaxID=60552 RepID=UPI001D138D2E|nr:phosphoadenosine phosphosulfate reductase family protein [Burkholderia vietnamiensis]UEC01660.1 phosphoadenosine phosphosulfate reductase family protein [Burkholderia vietnamiensis]